MDRRTRDRRAIGERRAKGGGKAVPAEPLSECPNPRCDRGRVQEREGERQCTHPDCPYTWELSTDQERVIEAISLLHGAATCKVEKSLAFAKTASVNVKVSGAAPHYLVREDGSYCGPHTLERTKMEVEGTFTERSGRSHVWSWETPDSLLEEVYR
jgi:hypothetical protein